MKKKALSLFICLCMLVAVLCGCGSQGTSAADASGDASAEATQAVSSAPAATQEVPAETTAPEEKSLLPICEDTTTIAIWTNYSKDAVTYFEGPGDTPWVAELEDMTNVHIDWTIGVGDHYMEALMVEIASGDLAYDVMCGLGRLYTGGQQGAYNDDLIIALNDYIDEYCPNYVAAMNSNPDLYAKNCKTDDGTILAFEKLYSENETPMYGLAIRKDWVDKLNMEMPVTIDEYHDVLTAFKTELGADSAMWICKYGNLIAGPFGSAYDVNVWFDPDQSQNMLYQIDGTVHFSPLEEGFHEYLELMRQWYSEGLIYKDFISYGSTMNPPDDILANDDCGIINTFAKRLEQIDEKSNGGSWIGGYTPVVEEGQQTHFLSGVNYVQSSWGAVVTTSCKNVEVVCKLFDWFYSEEGQLFCNYGTEGRTFDYVDGEPTLKYDVLFNNADFNYENDPTWYWNMGFDGWYTINTELNRAVYYSDNQILAGEAWLSNNDSDYVLPSGISLTSDETSAFSTIFNDCSTLVQEYYCGAIMGEVNLDDDYDNFIATLKSLGIEDALSYYQAALDRYQAR